jgi:hypothetical protein
MAKKILIFSAMIAALAVGALLSRTPAPAAAQPARLGADAQTIKIVDAANAFLGTLTDAQRKSAVFGFNDNEQRKRWSNLPVPIVGRAGVAWGDMNAAQRTALTNLLGAVLSPEGVKMVKEEMDADDTLRGGGGFGGGGGGRGPSFGSDFYYVSFLGAPSATSPWMMQFGGHHLAINATISGPNVTLAPTLTGGQPLRYTKDGKNIYIVAREAHESFAMLNALTPAQKSKAVLGARRIDLVLGAGHDGQTMQAEGLPASAMTEAQKAQFVAMIESRLNILNADDRAAAMAEIRKNLNLTYFAWFGPQEEGMAYTRVTGPTVILEFSPQDDVANHGHNIYRDPTNEYGVAWTR